MIRGHPDLCRGLPGTVTLQYRCGAISEAGEQRRRDADQHGTVMSSHEAAPGIDRLYLRRPDNEAPPRRDRLPPPSRKDSRSSRVWISADVYTPTRPNDCGDRVAGWHRSLVPAHEILTLPFPPFKTISTYTVSK